MSKDKQEMVTIEVPPGVAKRITEGCLRGTGQDGVIIQRACRAALEARKTKLERWMKSIGAPWELGYHGVDNVEYGRIYFRGDENPHSNTRGCHTTVDQARLMAAAPQLLEALIAMHRHMKEHGFYGCQRGDGQDDLDCLVVGAINTALPPDVAAEVLGE